MRRIGFLFVDCHSEPVPYFFLMPPSFFIPNDDEHGTDYQWQFVDENLNETDQQENDDRTKQKRMVFFVDPHISIQ